MDLQEKINLIKNIRNKMDIADKGKRVANLIIDLIVIVILIFNIIINILISAYYPEFRNPQSISNKLFIYILIFVYYFIFELFTGKTIGKLITKTIVVDNEGNHPNLKKILIRNFIRFIPFDGLSFLFGKVNGMHDTISKTTVINSKIKNYRSINTFTLIFLVFTFIAFSTCVILYLNFPTESYKIEAQKN